MSEVKFHIMDKPSNSKGWGRYSVNQDGRKIIQSNTGNEWVSSDKAGNAEVGTQIALKTQVMLRVGKNARAREEISTETFALIVEDGASCEIHFRPGSQGLKLAVTGARLANA